jgi:hypothetical protein
MAPELVLLHVIDSALAWKRLTVAATTVVLRLVEEKGERTKVVTKKQSKCRYQAPPEWKNGHPSCRAGFNTKVGGVNVVANSTPPSSLSTPSYLTSTIIDVDVEDRELSSLID